MRFAIPLVFIALSAFAQQKKAHFKLPRHAEGHYTPGIILAKLKPEKKGINLNQLLNNHSSIRSSKHLVSEKQQAKLRTKIGPRVSATEVDLSLYLEISFNGQDIETIVNKLYDMGYFEIVEPDYAATMNYSPSDPAKSNQYYLENIKAYQAWDITKGSHEIIIGIVDSGGDLDHPDIATQLHLNYGDPIDNIDNDNDGYIDNFRGWDFMGSDTLNLNLPTFLGDNDPSNQNGELGSHGTAVAGCAAAATDNSVGISGVGFNSKLLFTKQAADNQGTSNGTIYKGYSGILYAATHGAKIINCSWGGFVFSQIQQDLIDYVSEDLDCLIVAAAGNNNTGVPFYPASYNHVLSVAASGPNDIRASFSNFGKTIDLIAPGKNIYTTFFNNSYAIVDGTSFAAPITSGAAALVWSANPSFSATQVGEKLRVTADESIYTVNASSFEKKLGKGRLDVFRALTKELPAIRAANPKLLNANGTVAKSGEEAFLFLDFKNYLSPLSAGLTITLTSTLASYATVSKSTITPGSIATGGTINNKLSPFKLKLNGSIAQNTILDFILTYSDGEYTDYQYISFVVNPSFLDVDDNQIVTTLASNGRIGFEDASSQTNGEGFVFNDNSLLFEMGLILGSSQNPSKLFDNVRSTNSAYNQEFLVTQKIKEIVPGERSSSEIFGEFTDNGTLKTISVKYRSLVWKEYPRDKFVILEYIVKNISGQTLNNFHFGIFADWDITDGGGKDVARWDPANLLGYVRPAQADDKPHAGIALIKGIAPQYYAIDNNQSTPGAPFGLYDGFTDDEKTTAFSSGIGRTSAGESTGSGADVSHLIGAGPYNLAVNEEVTIVFALLAAPNLSELQFAAKQADTTYNLMLNMPKPMAAPIEICYGTPATIEASGASQFNWYKSFTGGEPFGSGSSFTTNNLFNDTVFYVSNADESYESVRTTVPVHLKANPTLFTTGSGAICDGKTISLSVNEADIYQWSNGATTQSIEVTEAGIYSVHIETNSPNCQSDSEEFTVSVNPVPNASFQVDGDLISGETITFTNASIGASQYNWDFGDSQKSSLTSPTHIYTTVKEYTVTLTASNGFGCNDSAFETILVITAVTEGKNPIVGYPIPTKNLLHVKHQLGSCQWKVFDATGKVHLEGKSQNDSDELSIDMRNMTSGMYYLTIEGDSIRATIRLIKATE